MLQLKGTFSLICSSYACIYCRESHTDYMVRRGIALIVNHGILIRCVQLNICEGFAATPDGQKDFLYKLATIAGAVQETCDQAGIVALLRAKSEYRQHEVAIVCMRHL
jgi:hypothetical protein